MFGSHTDACIRDHKTSMILGHRHGQRDLATFRREPDRVAQQIRDHLAHPAVVGRHDQWFGRQTQLELDALVLRLGFEAVKTSLILAQTSPSRTIKRNVPASKRAKSSRSSTSPSRRRAPA